ncbi:MAG: DUF5673 domain-containing protein [Erysipelotrichaceae bacterium]|nr:DUF5673 domain-containing protein [Erysipelotrichaceae bacterium]MDY5251737.1 DUF5673 domain-containing protein [Erysipelotrichaceae bacterium]
MEFLNNILLGLFIALAVYLTYGYFKTHKEVQIACKNKDKTKIFLYGSLMIMNILTLIVNHGVMDIIRTIIVSYVILLMFLLKDGIGKNGIIANSTFIVYQDIEIYDQETTKDGFKLYVGYRSANDRKKQRDMSETSLVFDAKDEKAIKELLQQKLPKKQRRMKKS